jgi:hypothetical protein
MIREVLWTRAAYTDLTWMGIKRGEWREIKREVERIAKVNYLCLDCAVCRVAQTDGKWWRLKIVQPSQIRVFFSASEKRIIVQAVLRRTERTYDICEILWRVVKREGSAESKKRNREDIQPIPR